MPACNFKWALHANHMHAWTVDTRPFSPIFRMGLGTKQVLAGLWYWAMSTLPTNPHNPLYVLHRWYWLPQSHTWQPLSTWTKEQAGNSNSPQVFHSLSQHIDETCSLSNRTCHCLWCTQPSTINMADRVFYTQDMSGLWISVSCEQTLRPVMQIPHLR